jgi:hypothetical protein
VSRLPSLIAYRVDASDTSVDISVECQCRRVYLNLVVKIWQRIAW